LEQGTSLGTILRSESGPPVPDGQLPLRDVQLQLRHADPRMTMRYDQAKNSLDRAAVLPYAFAQYGMLNAD